MKQVYLHFHHKEFDLLSDRSIRQFMRRVGTAVKEAQMRELSDFIFSLDLDYAEKRAMLDRLSSGSQAAPAYYVETIKKGSLTAWFVVSLVLIGALLQEPIIGLIDDRQKRIKVLRKARRYLKSDWANSTALMIAEQISGRDLGSHVVADNVLVAEGHSKVVVKVRLSTMTDESDAPRRQVETPKTIRQDVQQQLSELRSKRN